MSGETHDRGLIDTNVVIHLAALDDAHLPGEMVISAVTLAELSAGPHHIAIANQLPLYTTNPGDFTGLDDLATVVAVQRP